MPSVNPSLDYRLISLSGYLSKSVLSRITKPVIGIMGKTGVGKSSLCNALFQADISPVSDVTACTRGALRFRLQIGGAQHDDYRPPRRG
ncbi:tRNA modification GTPase TrmE [Budvicia aquatica]|uniref:tRNA modification GTPase TrmE n=1 Tax=Budvicia aquatica TaxID=82979 RepID=A0A484ZEH0_9GAMM|nr:tRNA modification GTPase TrmE [Budvicia aquatica]